MYDYHFVFCTLLKSILLLYLFSKLKQQAIFEYALVLKHFLDLLVFDSCLFKTSFILKMLFSRGSSHSFPSGSEDCHHCINSLITRGNLVIVNVVREATVFSLSGVFTWLKFLHFVCFLTFFNDLLVEVQQ